eukprot:gene10285-11382_t
MEHKEQEDLDLDGEGGGIEHISRSAEDQEFDLVVSALEEVVMDDRFQELQNSFCEKHCEKFEESKENRLEYTAIFNDYCDLIEKMIEDKLKEKIPGYSIVKMDNILRSHKDELSGETFDMLNTVWEFLEFKDLMLSYKRSRTTSSAVAAPTSEGLSISGSGRSAPSAGLDLSITGKHL